MDDGGEKYSWRENGECMSQVEAKRLSDASRDKICQAVQTKYPKKNMCAKAMMLNDLLSQFAQRKTDPHSACREALKRNNLHVVKKPKISAVPLRGETIKRAAAMLLYRASEKQVSELVTVMKSPKFKIADPRNPEVNVTQAVSTLSCYDKVPREPRVEIGDGDGYECPPEMTKKLEDISIECDLYDVSGARQVTANYDELCKKVEGSNLQAEPMYQSQICEFRSRFREYCTNMINPELQGSLKNFVAELSRLQRNLFNRDNLKGRSRRRYYAGFREIERRLQLKKIKLVIVATDLDTKKGELDKLILRFKESCGRHEVPTVFGLSRRELGYLTHGKGFVSCIGVANYESLEDKLHDALVKVLDARNQFRILKAEPDKTIDARAILTDDLLLSERVKVLLKTLAMS